MTGYNFCYQDPAFSNPLGFYGIVFAAFAERERYLRSIIRYGNYRTIFPTDLDSHQHQVAAMVRYLIPFLIRHQGDAFDPIRAIIQAYIHDDHEPFMEAGDFQSADRAHLNDQQKELLWEDEYRGIQKAIVQYPKRLWHEKYSYAVLLLDAAREVATFESELVKLADKLVGLGEALHEIHSGNDAMRRGTMSLCFQVMNVSPVEYYREYFSNIKRRLPRLVSSVDSDAHWFLQPLPEEEFPWKYHNLWANAISMYAPTGEQERLFPQ
ncbi:MAG: HD domain-containing protein [Candidatus Moranbacteria bacterium]|nr:HD domain-containing protein [Candidatus Moranbacteria bacterium]